jgi:peptide/nickel transport system permease protein
VLAENRAVHLLLPTITLVLIRGALYSRYQRSAMLDVFSADYIRTCAGGNSVPNSGTGVLSGEFVAFKSKRRNRVAKSLTGAQIGRPRT